MSDTRNEVHDLVNAMRKAGIPRFEPRNFCDADFEDLGEVVKLARKHRVIQERWHSEEMGCDTKFALEERQANIESSIQMTVQRYGLRAKFSGDPRGFTVKLHTPKGGVFNTLGGATEGYGIGRTQ